MILSERSKKVQGSPTLALAAKAIELKDKGVDVVSLSVGEPDWQSFEPCKLAGVEAINSGKTRYTTASGTATLKQALVDKYKKRFGFDLSAGNIVVTPGAKYAIQQAFWNILNPGEKVGIFVPFWASYTTMVEIADGQPVLIDLNKDFSLNSENLKKALDGGLKILLINSPNNPSGEVFDKKDYQELSKVLKDYPDVQIVLDDIYAELYWGGEEQCPHLFDTAPELKSRTLVISGASKVFSMTGWRIGWAMGEESIIKAISKHQSQTTGCPTSVSQEATLAGFSPEVDKLVQNSSKLLQERAEKGYKLLKDIPGVHLKMPQGAFYFWVNLSEILEKLKIDDREFSTQFLESKAVVVVPGTDFGQPGYVRMSFAVSEQVFSEGVKRLKLFLEEALN